MHENDFFNEDLLCALAGVAGEDNVLMSEPMREHTTFKIGGPATSLSRPTPSRASSPRSIPAIAAICHSPSWATAPTYSSATRAYAASS